MSCCSQIFLAGFRFPNCRYLLILRDIHNFYLMQATKIIHKGESRIKVDFPYNQEIAQVLKKIPGAKWSRTMNAWHIAYSKKEFNQLKTLFPEVEYPQKVIDVKPVESTAIPPKVESNRQPQLAKGVSVQVIGRSIVIKLPKNALDTHFIVSLRYSRWDAKQFCWIVPNYLFNH
jgi:integrase/recombinase XerD